jgi:DNA-binding MarR family transcriptional regulator
MSLPPAVRDALYAWVELFMFKSMHDLFQFLKDVGWSMAHYLVFMRLYKGGASTISELATFLGVTNAAASQMVDGLVRQGIVIRTEAADDRRFTHVMLTAQGRLLTEQCIAARYQWLDAVPGLSPQQQQVIIAGLEELTQVVRQLENTEGT